MFIDTSGFFSYLNTTDDQHARAVTLFETAPIRLTHNYVLAELVALSLARGVNRAKALEFVAAVPISPSVQMYWVRQSDHQDAVDLLQARPDKGYSLCDAVSFLLMRRFGISEALTADRHFEQEGFSRLLDEVRPTDCYTGNGTRSR